MIKEATVDAHDESEQMMGWFTIVEDHLDSHRPARVLASSTTELARCTLIDSD